MQTDAETRPVRAGEELDAEALEVYLRPLLGSEAGGIEISQFPSGSSNLTYNLRLGGRDYVLRRPPFGNTVRTAHDMAREFTVLSKLHTVYPKVPETLLLCGDPSIIGAPFYIMERLSGTVIRGTAPRRLLEEADLRKATAKAFIDNLAQLHAIDYAAAGLGDLGRPEGYARRQVQGWTERYFAAKTHQFDELEWAIDWLNENVPPDSGAALVHNDYKFDNIILDPDDPTRIVGVLDWELATIGDPLMDLGTTLGYWMSGTARDELLSMPFNPRILMEEIPRDRLVEWYAEASGRDVSSINYYHVFGTFKIAAIAQQIYKRHSMGLTKDPRFAGFHRFVEILGRIAFAHMGD